MRILTHPKEGHIRNSIKTPKKKCGAAIHNHSADGGKLPAADNSCCMKEVEVVWDGENLKSVYIRKRGEESDKWKKEMILGNDNIYGTKNWQLVRYRLYTVLSGF
jgi:hypothetical protein